MTDEQSAGTPCAADGDLRQIVAGHSLEITDIKGRLGNLEEGQHGLMREVVAVRAEGNARQQATNAGMDRIGIQIADLTRQLAAHTGAQQEQNRLAEANLRRWRLRAVIIGLMCTVGAAICSTLLSDQEVASTIWVKWLHWREPWDAPTQPVPQPQETQFILPPRDMEAA